MQIKVTDDGVLIRMAGNIGAFAKQVPGVLATEMNRMGATIRQQMVAAEAKQIGLKPNVLNRALIAEPATPGLPRYAIRSSGGNISLRYFNPHETGPGVVATPWGTPTLYAGAFMNGGRFPTRTPARRLNGQVYRREGSSRLPIEKVRSGAYIPTEMTKGETLGTFEAGVSAASGVIITRLGSLIGAAARAGG